MPNRSHVGEAGSIEPEIDWEELEVAVSVIAAASVRADGALTPRDPAAGPPPCDRLAVSLPDREDRDR